MRRAFFVVSFSMLAVAGFVSCSDGGDENQSQDTVTGQDTVGTTDLEGGTDLGGGTDELVVLDEGRTDLDDSDVEDISSMDNNQVEDEGGIQDVEGLDNQNVKDTPKEVEEIVCIQSPDDQTGFTSNCATVCAKALECKPTDDCMSECGLMTREFKVPFVNYIADCMLETECMALAGESLGEYCVEAVLIEWASNLDPTRATQCATLAQTLADCGAFDDVTGSRGDFEDSCNHAAIALRDEAWERVVDCNTSCGSIHRCFQEALCIEMFEIPDFVPPVEPVPDMAEDVYQPDTYVDNGPEDVGQPDLGPTDPGQPDLGPTDPGMYDLNYIDVSAVCRDYGEPEGFNYDCNTLCLAAKECKPDTDVTNCTAICTQIVAFTSADVANQIGVCVNDTSCDDVVANEDGKKRLMSYCYQVVGSQILATVSQSQKDQCDEMTSHALECSPFWGEAEIQDFYSRCIVNVATTRPEALSAYLACDSELHCSYFNACLEGAVCSPSEPPEGM